MTSQITKDFQMKSKLRKLADGGSRGEGGGLSKEAVMAAIAAQRGTPTPATATAPAPAVVQRPGGDYIRNPRSVLDARERAAGLADGGSAPFGSRGLSGLRDLIPQMEAMGFRQQPAQPDPTGLRAVMPRVKAMGYMDGGRVEGPGGRTDDKVGPVMLSDEEYVLPGDTADAIGRDKLDAIRLATHDFKDERKESALRGRMDDAPIDNLADGGNPWLADDKGNVRKPNSFGDAAAGPGYQQPRLPPPQPGTAVGPSALRPGSGPRNIYMGAAEDVTPRPAQIANNPTMPAAAKTAQPWTGAPPTNPNVGPGGSREAQAFRNAAGNSFGDAAAASQNSSLVSKAGSALRTTGGLLAKGAGVVGAGMAAKDMYDNGVNFGNSGDLLASGAAFAGPVGVAGAAGWGAGRAIGNNLSEDTRDLIGGTINQGVRNVGKLFGQDWGVDDSALLQQKAEAQLATSNARTAPGASSPAQSALRSDQGPALPVEPGSYQSRRLSEMGVPLDVQNSKPVVDSVTGNTRDFLRTGGTDQYQNLGTYGGNGNIYGKASDPSNPGRINSFAGVGAGASQANEASGSGWDSTVKSALRGLGNGPSAPGGSGNSGPADNSAAINARYDKLAKNLSGMYGPKGQGNLARRMLELEQSRSTALDADARNVTSRSNAAMQNSTLRDNAQLNARTSMLDVLGRMEHGRATLSQQAQVAQLKALQDAQKISREGEEKGFDRYTGAIGSMFTTVDKDGKQTVDKAAQERFRAFIEGSDPQAGKKFAQMAPQQQQVLLQNFKTMFDMNETRNKTAQSGSWPSNTGGVTNRMDMPTDVREATWNDYWNNNLPLKDYLWSTLWGTNPNVVVTESGQPTLYSDYTSTGGERDLDKEKIVRDSVSARSKLRSN